MVDSKRHTVELARRPHIGEGAWCDVLIPEDPHARVRYTELSTVNTTGSCFDL